MSAVAATRPASPAAPAPARDRGPVAPFWISCAVCLALAALSAAVLPTVPSYDPWSWIVWGHEVSDSALSFTVGGGPSWKPLPVLFTTVWGLFGGAAPTLWVITARAGGFLGLVAAYRLASRLVGAGRWAAVAGVLAALAVVLTQEWAYYMFRGTSEPMLIGASLWAVEMHLAGRRGHAFWLAVAASLIRPEAWPFLLGYAIWLFLREPRLRVWLILGLLAVPFFWFVPPWIGSGQPFLAASHAKAYNGHLGGRVDSSPCWAEGSTCRPCRSSCSPCSPSSCAGRDRTVLTLAGFAVIWWVIVVAMTLDGYPGLERFYLPAAAVTCVLAGAGVVFIGRLAAARFESASGVRTAVAGVVAIVLVAACVPFVTTRISVARAQKSVASRAVTRLDQLSAAVAAVGGHHGVFPCRSSFAAVNHGVQTALAWKLHVTLGRVGTVMRHQGVLFVGPHDTIDGGPAPVSRRLTSVRLLTTVGAWKVYRVTAPGAHTGCVGS